MDANDAEASRGAFPDDIDEDMHQFLQLRFQDRVSARKRDNQLIFEQEKKALGEAKEVRKEEMRKREQKMRELEQEMRELEREDAADTDKERCLETNYHVAMRKLNRLRCVVNLQQSAPSEEPTRPAVEPSNVAATLVPLAASIPRTGPDTEDEQAQNSRDMQQGRSNRSRRLTAIAQPRNTDAEPGVRSDATAAPSSPLQRTSSPPRQTRSHGLSTPAITHQQGRRRRKAGDDNDKEDGDDANHRPPKRLRDNNRTVSFEEVYGNGRPEYSHTIVEYPEDSGNWFIIRCEECGLHFGRNAIQGGAKHLSSARHGRLPRKWALAVQEFGFRVLGCDKDKAKRNNDAFNRASEAGYVPRKGFARQTRNQRQQSAETSDEEPSEPFQTGHPRINATSLQGQHQKGRVFEGVSDPVVGRLYRAWYRGKGFYAALLLPLDSFETVGVVGDISNIDQQKKAPKCYRRSAERILGWASGYEDGGPKSRERKFPMMYFEGSADLSFRGSLVIPPSLGWVAAKNLRPFDPECQRTKGSNNAQTFLERARMSNAITAGGTSAGKESDRGSGQLLV
ncbi:hypothetical protein B0T26DRAFT_719397 [Lasiosphaeria miniovina]|uniref:Uncharacterized protein n=1 Tax=Lasiosphaeria miniovina TaxID=1954250 RepID=A0AA40ADW6_9PEZI|nr:uncharacterized protein B0T26DRAFT_719397 [Lasiosphaeria miniovina]KAK0714045.1 hypothetical protein B0T26DRAFT_719397 [Lasiosphaeria miniovina]